MSTRSFMEAMMLFTGVQKKAQMEIDRVAKDRLPAFSDMELIAYVRCLMKGLWRWGHQAIGHDPERYEDPDRYWPERYMHDKTTSINSSDVSLRDHFTFGAGRRVCPGCNVAERSLAISIMRLLWSFDITLVPGTILPLDPARYPSMMPGNPGLNLPVTLTVTNFLSAWSERLWRYKSSF
ncbi:cytochrome P450 [Bisporella sp. PMI_857]|nr:cytochrome P450 [Bisporella sp. PMI_857]